MLSAGCATQEGFPDMPGAWRSARPGMQREQVQNLLGVPSQSGPGEDTYLAPIKERHFELHLQYDAGGTLCEKRYHFLK